MSGEEEAWCGCVRHLIRTPINSPLLSPFTTPCGRSVSAVLYSPGLPRSVYCLHFGHSGPFLSAFGSVDALWRTFEHYRNFANLNPSLDVAIIVIYSAELELIYEYSVRHFLLERGSMDPTPLNWPTLECGAWYAELITRRWCVRLFSIRFHSN